MSTSRSRAASRGTGSSPRRSGTAAGTGAGFGGITEGASLEEMFNDPAWPQYSPMPIPDEAFPAPRKISLPAMDAIYPTARHTPFNGDSRALSPARPATTALEMTSATQLVERYPQVDIPQRIQAPGWMNAPRRKPSASADERAEATFTSTQVSKNRNAKYDIRTYEHKTAPEATSPERSGPQRDNTARNKLKDHSMLAFACRRADQGRMEAASHYCMGVLHDNLDEFQAAIKCYQAFSEVAKVLADTVCEALAYNCMGVNFQFLAKRSGEKAEKCYKLAIHYHTKHLGVADEQGRFVAHTNLGLAYCSLGRFDAAARAHQDALRIAIRLGSAFGQSIAVGNLGMVAMRQGDLDTAKACLDQHLALVRDMRDKNAEAFACQQLGSLANEAGDYRSASEYFEEARRVAQAAGAKGLTKAAAVRMGVAKGNLQLILGTTPSRATTTGHTDTRAGASAVLGASGRNAISGSPM